MSRFFERERACQLPPSGCIASKEPGRVSGVDRHRHAVLSLSLPSVPCVSSYFSFSSALSSPIHLSSYLSFSLLCIPPPTLSLLLPPPPIDILFLCNRGSSLMPFPLDGPTSSITGLVLYVHAKLRLSMLHPLVTAGRTMAIGLLAIKRQQLVLGWLSAGGFEVSGFAVSC